MLALGGTGAFSYDSWLKACELEQQAELHLDLPRAADGVRCYAKAERAVVKARVARIAGGQDRRTGDREAVIVLVLRYLVAGHVEAAGLG